MSNYKELKIDNFVKYYDNNYIDLKNSDFRKRLLLQDRCSIILKQLKYGLNYREIIQDKWDKIKEN